ncbi:hypothetical protein ISN44_As02g008760 [Arabidopsis suecica]|uniref:Uncharacterized protein n=1 Tax=Arabidopsis suecica TaxID=45249 RepID=A0A8T2G2E1_ARASU|nr:hypothetical protein ISN44_As02g008760 [Arabidopsis suecica]
MGDPWVCSDALILVLPRTLFSIHLIRRSVCPTRSVRRSACPIRPVRRSVCPIGLADPIQRLVYQIRFVFKTNGLPSTSSTLHRTVGPGGSMRIRGEWMLPEASHPVLAPFRKVTSVLCILSKGHICSLHPLGDATVCWYPLDLTPFGRDTSSPVSYHSPPARVSADRTTQLGQTDCQTDRIGQTDRTDRSSDGSDGTGRSSDGTGRTDRSSDGMDREKCSRKHKDKCIRTHPRVAHGCNLTDKGRKHQEWVRNVIHHIGSTSRPPSCIYLLSHGETDQRSVRPKGDSTDNQRKVYGGNRWTKRMLDPRANLRPTEERFHGLAYDDPVDESTDPWV